LCRSGRTGKTSKLFGDRNSCRSDSPFASHALQEKGKVYTLQVFLPMTISIKKGVDDHRQKTGNKSGEQTSPFLFPNLTFGSAKAKDSGNCLPLPINPDVLPTCFG
jgi:hypothetical protein